MPSHDEFERITAEFGSFDGREQRITFSTGPLPYPEFQNFERFLSQRCTALLAPLALTPDVGSRARQNIAAAEADEFRDSQPCLQRHEKECMVATSYPCGWNGRGQQGIHPSPIQKLHRSSHMALGRHGQDSLAMKQVRGLVHGYEPEEGSDRGKTGIAAAGAVVALRFNMSEEVADSDDIYVLDP